MLQLEPEATLMLRLLSGRTDTAISAGNYLESSIVIERADDPLVIADMESLIHTLSIVIAPVTAEQSRIASQAYRDFGKGSGHSAKLNYGDCFAYALATDTGRPLLYKGDDFYHAGFKRLV